MKKTIFLLLTIIMVLCITTSIPLSASAATTDKVQSSFTYTDEYGSWKYEEINDGKGCKITDYTGSMTDIKIPDSIYNQPVLEIGDYVFERCDYLTSVILPNSVTTIGEYAFYECCSLTKITIPNTVTTIGEGAFRCCCSLMKIGIPNSVTTIGNYAFSRCENVYLIGIPSSVTYIGENAFSGCGYYPKVYYTGSESEWKNISNCSGLERITIHYIDSSGIYTDQYGEWTYEVSTDSTGYKITGYDESMTDIEIPESINDIDIIEIGAYAFDGCSNLTKITIPYYIDSIGEYAFNNCSSLTKIKFAVFDYLTSIEASAFRGCSSLINIEIPDGVTYIGEYAFSSCSSLTSIKIPNSVTYIGEYTFSYCNSLKGVKLPNCITLINSNTFYECHSLTRIGIPSSVATIDYHAFYALNKFIDVYYTGSESEWYNIGVYGGNGCIVNANVHYNVGEPIEYGDVYEDQYGEWIYKPSSDYIGYQITRFDESMTDIEIPSVIDSVPVLEIGDRAFSGNKNITSVTIPNGITAIGEQAFDTCVSLTSVSIPDSVTYIGNQGFSSCHDLKNITLPDKVATIGDEAFYYCLDLTNITIPSSVNHIGERVLYYCQNLTDINVSTSNKHYTSLDGVLFNKSKSKLICYPKGKNLKEYTIPNSVKSIGNYAFYYCSNLNNITIPNSVTSIGDYAFENCTGLTNITIPNSVTSIGNSAFEWCVNLIKITIPESVTFIGDLAFFDCSDLTEIAVSPNNKNYSSIDGVLFNKLQSELICYPERKLSDTYIIPDTVTLIYERAFYSCRNLKNITIPNGVTSIGKYTFFSCDALTEITIPNSITSIVGNAFSYCVGLRDVYYTGNESEWNSISTDKNNNNLTNANIHFNYVPPITGDISGDGEIAIDDVIYILKYIVGSVELTDEQIKKADINSDGKFTILDAILIQRIIIEIV